jgi:hypothetical protein
MMTGMRAITTVMTITIIGHHYIAQMAIITTIIGHHYIVQMVVA